MDTAATVDLLNTGEVEVLGVLPYASNYTFLTRVTGEVDECLAVYKPRRGERPLWDFPNGTLGRREVAAFLVSEAAGLHIVPPTVLRTNGPMGDGSLQFFIEHDPERHYFTLLEERLEDFAVFAAFDVVINNADRKAGHILEGAKGRLWGVDHGVSFHVEPKLRTVIWEFAERPLGPDVRAALERLRSALTTTPAAAGLEEVLAPDEVTETLRRTEMILAAGHFPPPRGHYPLPWPLV